MTKVSTLLERGVLGALIAAAAAPALGSVGQVQVPEPGTLGIFTVGIGAAYLVSKYRRRK